MPEQRKEVQLERSRAYNKKSYYKKRATAMEAEKRAAEADLERRVQAAVSARTLAEVSVMELETKQWALLGKLHDAKARLAVVKAHHLLDEVHGRLNVAMQRCTETLRHMSSGKHLTEVNGAHERSALETEKCCSRVTSIICAWHDQIAKPTAENPAAAAKPSAPPIQRCTSLALTTPSFPTPASHHTDNTANGYRRGSTVSDSDSSSSDDADREYESDSDAEGPP
jgi:hypothetical protein